MKKFLLAGSILTALSFSALTSKAQNDSTYFDLGRVRVKKDFTQAVTVKGADLERYPFTNIASALNVWFTGIYLDSQNTLYVIDGNLINDINSYSVQDIEEVSLIQNALVQVNGAYQQKQLVAITTRRQHAQNAGVRVSAMINAVARSHDKVSDQMPDNGKTTVSTYHEYNVAAFKKNETSRFGLSFNYQHDVQPLVYDKTIYTDITNKNDPRFNRVRLFGYAEKQVFAGTVAGVKLGYANQKGTEALGNYSNQLKQNFFSAEAYVNSNIYKGLRNSLNLGFNNNRPSQDDRVIVDPNATPDVQTSSYKATSRQFLLRDNLSYNVKAGDVEIEPMVNFSYQHTNDTLSLIFTSPFNSGSTNEARFTTTQLMLTPSINLSYKNIANLQGGFTRMLKSKAAYVNTPNSVAPPTPENKTLPFVTGSVNSSNFIPALKLTVYGSYSKSVPTLDNVNSLYTSSTSFSNLADDNLVTGLFNIPVNAYTNKVGNTINLGAKVDVLNNKLTISYNHEKRKYDLLAQYMDNFGNVYFYNPDATYRSHRAEVSARIIDADKLRLISNLNATHIETEYAESTPFPAATFGKKIWSGGWANRLSAGKIFAGIDMLYLFSVKENYPLSNVYNKLKPLSLQNIYFGYTFTVPVVKQLQVFVNARNMLHTVNSALTDNRYFIGGGVSAAF
ncbi:autotransporter domain-containing protein [Mucilaginibacter conchicola]|uniref:autotransporter domain-containing protein n=1 Tax=Mucilaginibacter conchicola TaxID=2303333 RepID=UPI001314CB96|nr:autotransporter domain-containing protein [Mucilaginibacter conchicola]